MPKKSLYDTRFFVEYFYSSDPGFLRKLKEDLRSVKERKVSAVTIHEIYRIDLEKEGRDVARIRSETIRRSFDVLSVDHDIAVKSAEMRKLYMIPMADSIIAATSRAQGCPVVTDDPHFQIMEEIKTRWYK
ncbi:PIN domain-containing protein [Candidatus Bathyarchaeota archaeon]|nr:PIN domain-containing protein [Candidatus Bathyarchaeota archaeon]